MYDDGQDFEDNSDEVQTDDSLTLSGGYGDPTIIGTSDDEEVYGQGFGSRGPTGTGKTGKTGPATGPPVTGKTGPTGKSITGPTGKSVTGPRGITGVGATGKTGPTGPIPSGAPGTNQLSFNPITQKLTMNGIDINSAAFTNGILVSFL